MLEYYLFQTISVAVPSALMYWRGVKYANKENSALSGAILRATGWSLVLCWTALLAAGQGVAVIPLPSWGAVLFWLIEDVSSGVRIQFIPYPLLSPAIPIAIFLLAYKLHRPRS